MSPTYSLIEARRPAPDQVSAGARIAGLSLIARHARMAARRGFAGAVVRVADEDSRRALDAALAEQPPPAGFAVEYVIGEQEPPADRAYVPVSLYAVYTADALARAAESGAPPAAERTIGSPADARAAEARLYQLIRKSIDQDGVVAYYLMRPLSGLMTRLLIDTPVTPNQVTLTAMAAGIAAAISAGVGGLAAVALAGLLYWVGAVVDCVDGELARLRVEGSKMGEWLDTLADDVSTYGMMAGLGVGLMRDGYSAPWVAVSIGAAIVGVLVQVKLYIDLHRMGSIIDTAQYPWFFGKPSDGSQGGKRSLVGQLFYGVAFLFRRDAFVTIISVLLVAGQRLAAVAIMVGGVAVVLLLFIVHHLVMAIRGAARAA